MQFNFDPIKPYLTLIKVGLGLVIASVLIIGGCNYGKSLSASELAAKDTELGAAAAELSAAKTALESVNAEAKRRKDEAERQRKKAELAAQVAKEAQKQLDERTAAFSKELERARRKSPTCAALLDTNVRSTCDL